MQWIFLYNGNGILQYFAILCMITAERRKSFSAQSDMTEISDLAKSFPFDYTFDFPFISQNKQNRMSHVQACSHLIRCCVKFYFQAFATEVLVVFSIDRKLKFGLVLKNYIEHNERKHASITIQQHKINKKTRARPGRRLQPLAWKSYSGAFASRTAVLKTEQIRKYGITTRPALLLRQQPPHTMHYKAAAASRGLLTR